MSDQMAGEVGRLVGSPDICREVVDMSDPTGRVLASLRQPCWVG